MVAVFVEGESLVCMYGWMDVFARIRYRMRLFEWSEMGWLPLRVWRLGLGSIPRERGFLDRA